MGKQREKSRRPRATAASAEAGIEIVESRKGVGSVLAGGFAVVATFFLGIRPDLVKPLIEPDSAAQIVLWRIAVIVIGILVTVFVALMMRDMFLPDGQVDRYVSPSLIVSALSVTGASTLWALLVAVSATGGSVPADAIGYIGNTTVLGVLLGLVIVAVIWSFRAYGAVAELIRHGGPRNLFRALCGIAIVLLFLLAVPISNAFRA